MKAQQNLFFQLAVLAALGGTAIAMSCNTGHKVTKNTGMQNGKSITVTGTALHAKAGAIVQTEKEVYYIKGRQDWGELYNKKVKVTGKLETVTYDAKDLKDENGHYSQGFAGTVHYIAEAKVEEVK